MATGKSIPASVHMCSSQRVPVICPKPERTGFSQVQNHQVPALPLVPLTPLTLALPE